MGELNHIRGCLLGGAIGDALGAPVGFMSTAEIRRRFGPDGIGDYSEAYGRRGAITDDTQMTLFTAEGMLRAFVRETLKGMTCPVKVTSYDSSRMHDIIGDIHGQADKLEALLRTLGYRERGGAWRHPARTAIFVGDFVDRGPAQVRSVTIARRMVDAGAALAVMGNHELNAIAWHTPDPNRPGEYLRPRHSPKWGEKNRHQHAAFLAEVEHDAALHAELIDWFLTLPLWIDLPAFRVVHACPHSPFLEWLKPRLHRERYLTRELMVAATDEPEDEAEKDNATPSIFKAVEALTKGIEVPLPPGRSFLDKDGHTRDRVRVRWWDEGAASYRKAAMLSPDEASALPDVPIPQHARIPLVDRPVFFGHYWLTGDITLQSHRHACVDYSAGKGGPLVAYRYDGESELSLERFVSVP